MSPHPQAPHRAGSSRPHPGGKLADHLTHVVDACLVGIVLVAPYFMGGRHPVGQLVYVALAAVMAMAWMLRQWLIGEAAWRFSGLELLLLAGVLVVALQTVPLPPKFLAAISPATARVLPADNVVGAPLSSWPCISLLPTATRDGLIVLLAHGLVALITIQRIKSIHDAERLLTLLAAAAVLMAVIGLLQYALSNGRFLWVYEHPRRGTDDAVKGSFINRNHFTNFLALGVGPLVWCLSRGLRSGTDSRQRSGGLWPKLAVAAPAVGLVIVLFAGLSSLSRGGAVALAVALFVSTLLLWRCGAISSRFLAAAAGVTLVLGASLMLHGYDKVQNRLDDLTEGSIEQLDNARGRRRVWEANWQAFQDFRWFGTGVSTHFDVYKMYMTEWSQFDATHAESGYFQIASSLGTAGLSLLLATFALAGYACYRTLAGGDPRTSMVLAAVVGALAASVVHSVVDFVWFIPACMSVTAICAGCALRLWTISRGDGGPRIDLPRAAWGALVVGTLAAGTWMIGGQWGPAKASIAWDAYLRDDVALQRISSSAQSGDTSWTPAEIAKNTVQRRESMFEHLQRVVAADPNHGQAHKALAGEYLLRFEERQQTAENVMPLSQVCDTVMTARSKGKFSGRQELDAWLSVSVKDNKVNLDSALWHTRRALSLSPLQGESYIFLSQLCFLEGANSQARQQYVAQALRVRPLSEGVLLGAADEALIRGKPEEALAFVKQAFHMGGRYRPTAIRLCAGRFPVAYMIQEFKPDFDDWPEMYAVYRQLDIPNRQNELLGLCQHYVRLAEQPGANVSGVPAARMWADIGEVNLQLGAPESAAECARRALRCAPDHKKTRMFCGTALCAAGLYEEAEPHIRWCLQRTPGDSTLQTLAQKAAEARHAGKVRVAAGPAGTIR